MSDTRQCVRWSLGDEGVESGEMWFVPPPGRKRPNEVLWDSIKRTGLENRLRDNFQVTDPLWYGFWIDSLLSREQCSVLYAILADAVAAEPTYDDYLHEFLIALDRARSSNTRLFVRLDPPGHIDCGCITTFVHCPRCKAEGPLKRWQSTYPSEPIACPVCGQSYSPAATFSMRLLQR